MLKAYDLNAVSTESLTAAQLRIDSGIETLILEIVNRGIECKGSPEQICRSSTGMKNTLEALETLQKTRALIDAFKHAAITEVIPTLYRFPL